MPEPATFTEFCNAGLWPGVGKVLAADLTAAGIRGPRDVNLATLSKLPRVTAKRADRLYTSWIGAGLAYDVAELLVPEEISIRWVARLMESLGENAAQILRGDPWRLLVLPEALVSQADQLARSLDPGVRREDPRRGRALVAWTLNRFAREGHTATSAADVAAGLRPFGCDPALSIQASMDAGEVVPVPDPTIDPLADDDAEFEPGDNSDDMAESRLGETPWIATLSLAEAEASIAENLARLQATAKPLAQPAVVTASSKGLDSVQISAVMHAAVHGVSLLTGGPGTGKSRTVAAIVEVARAASVVIALAAPTGRAAKRLEELTGAEATTIHRLLGARGGPVNSGDRFEKNSENQIEADVIVIDEASMLDVELAAALLESIADGTHLVIVGDPAQLPSIGPGRVLGDLLDTKVLPTTHLSTLYRQSEGGSIARLATAVRGGTVPPVNDPTHEVVVVTARSSGEAAHRVVQLVTDSIPRVFQTPADQIQVVTPVHKGEAGTQALNRALKAALNPGRGQVRGFDKGDRVVATANHLDAEPNGYANGEVGTVIAADDNSLRVAFSVGESTIAGKALNDLLHGWAITVHRAQGSEWETVVVVVPAEAGNMLSRPLFYTALTRARHHLSIVHAAGPALARAVEQIGERPRRTRLWSLVREEIGSLS
ncbi:exodeoxyribonuclease V [Nakamurella antarctica]|uniref:Exodeoxyribonuclease V n=1 Tax=Nakamurella antarctica TaxID=1902245 RepID=A0A3G8ZLE1_9ACTN|nr:AAA family ATPase [Nakamurella antarctica]AZI57968.1 exodeoxyribonuclease V [Nakamurella antarctica]